jgi:hypothetical protein
VKVDSYSFIQTIHGLEKMSVIRMCEVGGEENR